MAMPLRGVALGSQVVEILRVAIVTGEIPNGMRLVEETIAGKLGVSRGPVRDALRRLEIEGLVARSAPTGYVAQGLTEADIDEIYSLRDALELLAWRRSVGQAGEREIAYLRSCIDEMLDAAGEHDVTGFAKADVAFHTSLFEMSGHRRLIAAWNQLAPQVSLVLGVTNSVDTDLAAAAQMHRDLVEALVSRNTQALEHLLHAHLFNSRALLTRARDTANADGAVSVP